MMHIFERSSGIHTGAIGAALASSGIAALIALTHAAFSSSPFIALHKMDFWGLPMMKECSGMLPPARGTSESVTSRSSSV